MIGRLAEYEVINNIDFKIFHKTYLKSRLYKINSIVSDYFFCRSRIFSHIDYKSSPEEKTQKETITIKLWDNYQIPTVQFFGFSEDQIFEKCLEDCLDYEDIFSNLKNPKKELDSFLELYTKIRSIAKKENNPLILHSDSHLKNFLYDYERNSCVAIDPGVVLRENISFEEIDRNLLIFTLLSFNGLDIDHELKNYYMKSFVDNVFSSQDKSNVLNLLGEKCVFEYFLVLKEFVASTIKNRKYSEKRLSKIDNLEDLLS
ncbi:MAG: hypothetical protein PHT94_00120 [Candidatus Nanoarchaeia archaeon]|nr:hypothetical protein [Candidatus Nanoarchaeia archaeon]